MTEIQGATPVTSEKAPSAAAAETAPPAAAAEKAMMDAEGYAEEGLAEHKGGKHLEEYWHKGRGGLRAEGEDPEEERQRLQELEEHQAGKGIVQRTKESVSATVAAASEKAADVLQTAKEMAGFGGSPSKQ
ncbi:hypothetical protein D9Q98_004977 [Chlorella vulgaris]|uniref:Uncharacterized protein n=1 Tax=Chlorella vulgaris TaxID=3077 RepID=A0A9D4TNF9_CHLVU|nr:hypothetical protein D9Q98_004977 [Chlorella vulgaris]